MSRELIFKIIKEGGHKNKGGFTLIELVITIILIGIMSVGLYNIVLFGIKDYMMNENYLHQTNSMSLAISIMRMNISDAAMPLKRLNVPRGKWCPLKRKDNPKTKGNPPIVVVNGNEIAFYKYIDIVRTTNQELVVFCVYNNVLYKQVTTNQVTTDYPSLNNISNIAFSSSELPPPPVPPPVPMYYYYINMEVSALPSGYSENENGGASVIVANPQE